MDNSRELSEIIRKDSHSIESAFMIFNQMNEVRSDGNDSNLLIVFYVQIMPDDLVMQLHRF